jgi:hypothetical protein
VKLGHRIGRKDIIDGGEELEFVVQKLTKPTLRKGLMIKCNFHIEQREKSEFYHVVRNDSN